MIGLNAAVGLIILKGDNMDSSDLSPASPLTPVEEENPGSTEFLSLADFGGTDDSLDGSPDKPVDAKSSALKALSGVTAVVSKSREVDAQALQEIRQQRASRIQTRTPRGGPSSSGPASFETPSTFTDNSPRHSSRSTVASISSSGGAGSSGAVLRSNPTSSLMGSSQVPSTTTTATASSTISSSISTPGIPTTSPQAYTDWLSQRSLSELLALQIAVQLELDKQLTAAHLPSIPSNYSSTILAVAQAQLMQQQQQQQQQQQAQQQQQEQQAMALHHALAMAANTNRENNNQMGYLSPTYQTGSQQLTPREVLSQQTISPPLSHGVHSMPSTPDSQLAAASAGNHLLFSDGGTTTAGTPRSPLTGEGFFDASFNPFLENAMLSQQRVSSPMHHQHQLPSPFTMSGQQHMKPTGSNMHMQTMMGSQTILQSQPITDTSGSDLSAELQYRINALRLGSSIISGSDGTSGSGGLQA